MRVYTAFGSNLGRTASPRSVARHIHAIYAFAFAFASAYAFAFVSTFAFAFAFALQSAWVTMEPSLKYPGL